MPTDLDLFAGPGGWDQGIRGLGVAPLGIELDPAACATAEAAGHWRLRADVSRLQPATFGPVRGLIASPPCPGFSLAGKGRGRDDAVHLLAALTPLGGAWGQLEEAMAGLHAGMTDDRSLLALEPLRWCLELQPAWTAWEQVPPVLPLWEACAVVLRRAGYSVATGMLSSEQFGVPQTRARAFLVARSPDTTDRLGPAVLPAPTHSRYYPRDPQRLDPGVAPWLSMAEALGWEHAPGSVSVRTSKGEPRTGNRNGSHLLDPAVRPAHVVTGRLDTWAVRSNYGTGGDPRARGLRTAGQPAAAVTGKVGRNRWTRPGGNAYRRTAGGYVRVDESVPSRTVKPGNPRGASAGPRFDDLIRLPSEAPQVSTAQARELLGTTERHARVSVAEAAVLQSFPPDYPWQGTPTAQYRQVGDAVPPLLARAVVAAVAGCEAGQEGVA